MPEVSASLRQSSIVVGALVAALLPGPTPVEAQDAPSADPPREQISQEGLDDEVARQRFNIGRSLYDAGRFVEAGREFVDAFRLSPRPILLFNAFVAYRDAGDLDNAVDNLRRYLEVEPAAPNAAQLQIRLQGMEEALQQQRERDAAAQAEAEREAAERAAAARAEAEREAAEREAALQAQLDQQQGSGVAWLPWTLVGVGAAMGIAGTATGVVTLGRVDDIAAMCPNDTCPPGVSLSDERSDAKTLGIVTDLLLFGGGAIAVTGVVLLIAGVGRASEPPPASAACGPDGCSLQLRGSF